MDKIKYQENQTTQQNGQYPLTIQGLEFIQNQIMCLQNIVPLGGDYIVIRESSGTANGVVVFNGEIMPLQGAPIPEGFINVTTTKETIYTNSGDYRDVREVRIACYSRTKPQESSKLGLETVKDFRERRYFQEWKTNAELWAKLQELMRSGTGIPVETGIFSRAMLDARITTARLVCLAGSSAINSYTTYAVDVYMLNGGDAYQELRGTDFRRFGRYYKAATKKWGDFQPISDQFAIEAKVTTNTVMFRHGFLPPYVSLIALRKKSRNRNAGRGRVKRSLKNAWYNAWKMTFTKGEPNMWYVPKCISADSKFKAHVNSEFPNVVRSLLLISSARGWRLAGVHRNWKKRPYGYAKIALGIVASTTHNAPVLSMARLRFRIARKANTSTSVFGFTTD